MILRPLLAFFATALLSAVSARAGDWHVIKEQGRDYVSFANVAEFYHFGQFRQVNHSVSLTSDRRGIRAQAGTSDLFVNGVRFFTDFPLLSAGDETLISAVDVGKIIEPILRPSRIPHAQKVETVVLDPGHGGMDPGAADHWGTEKNYALDVALRARAQLERDGFKVQLTRSSDVAVSLEERVAFANRFPNSVFVSLHFNSGGGEGVESYLLAPDGVPSDASGEHHVSAADSAPNEGNAQDGENIALAAAVHAAVLSHISAFDRGVRHARFKVLRDIRVPAVLVECGFLTDSAEGQRVTTTQYREELGTAIAQGVETYNTAVNYRSPSAGLSVAKANLPPHTRSITEPLTSGRPPSASQEPTVSVNGSR